MVCCACRDEVDLQRRLSLHPNVVRFMGACCHIPSTGRPFQDDTLDNWQVRPHTRSLSLPYIPYNVISRVRGLSDHRKCNAR